MLGASLIVLLGIWCTGSSSQPTVIQESSMSPAPGQTVKLSCSLSSGSVTTYYQSWYQQKEGGSPIFLYRYYSSATAGTGDLSRFSASKESSQNKWYLTIRDIQPGDEANYYCAVWYSASNVWVFGGGTQLIVTGQDPVSPSVQVFAPSEQEIKTQKKATLVCLLSGFHPPAFTLKWKVDGTETTSGVETTKATKQGDKYLASSYLTRSDSDYGDHTYVCEVIHNGNTFTKALTGSGSYSTVSTCASLWYIFGEGTQLIVTGQTNVSPSVQVFAPSQEEVRNPNPYTFVCLLTEFYPPAFELQWKVDGKVITSEVETTKASKQDGKYLASSYMKMTEAEYRDHKAVTCEVTHDSKTIAKSVSKSGSC
ncbi:immunoglobulin lambda-1 light chain-like [Pantherophis guttatus]|uniref:immunoglobulin lambda-1 light chain-like n=1 Tax=Pantherophis guttatus TaxID=94885 RepID=UPI00295B482F|nr:immunoglobulin lambda-1 light chain-like [Pantherophis guttatus]